MNMHPPKGFTISKIKDHNILATLYARMSLDMVASDLSHKNNDYFDNIIVLLILQQLQWFQFM